MKKTQTKLCFLLHQFNAKLFLNYIHYKGNILALTYIVNTRDTSQIQLQRNVLGNLLIHKKACKVYNIIAN